MRKSALLLGFWSSWKMADYLKPRHGTMCDQLLDQVKDEHAPTEGGAAAEAEDELIQVVL